MNWIGAISGAIIGSARGGGIIGGLIGSVIGNWIEEKVREYLDYLVEKPQILNITLPDDYVEHGNVDILRKEVGIDTDTIVTRTLERYERLK